MPVVPSVVLYVASFTEAVYVLHAFGKKSYLTSTSNSELATSHLRSEGDMGAHVEVMPEDCGARMVPIAPRTEADAVGGMAALTERTGVSGGALYRTRPSRGNPRFDTLAALLEAIRLRLSARPMRAKTRRATRRPLNAAT